MIKGLWRHWWRALNDAGVQRTSFWFCFKATICVLLSLEAEYDYENWVDVHWFNFGGGNCDYGEYDTWDTLAVSYDKWRFTIYDDASM